MRTTFKSYYEYTKKLLVSIVVPFYNARNTLKGLLLSLLSQDFPKDNYEIVLVDDATTDGSREIVEDFIKESPVRIRLLSSNKHKGCFSARNLGITASEGEIIAFTDADVIADKKWLRCLVNSLLKDESLAGVCGRVAIDDILIYPVLIAPSEAVGITSHGQRFGTCNIAYRKQILSIVGGFDERFDPRYRGDSDLGIRIIKAGFKIAYEPKAVIHHPARELSLSDLWKMGMAHSKDNLLYAKHGDLSRYGIGSILTHKPILKIFSSAGIIFFGGLIIFLLALALLGSILTLTLLFLVAISWILFFISQGYKHRIISVIPQGKRISIKLRIKASIWLIFHLIFVMIFRIYGSIKYRNLFI